MRSSKRDAAGVFGRSRELFEQVVAGWRTPAMPRPPPHIVAGKLRTSTIRSLQKSRTRSITCFELDDPESEDYPRPRRAGHDLFHPIRVFGEDSLSLIGCEKQMSLLDEAKALRDAAHKELRSAAGQGVWREAVSYTKFRRNQSSKV